MAVSFNKSLSVDILALPKSKEHYAIVGEVKNRDNKKFSKDESIDFYEKYIRIKEKESLSRSIAFVFSRKGFTSDAVEYLNGQEIAYSQDECWLEVI